MKKKGFTLIELLAVVLILAIIALILIPVVNKIIESARDAANKRSVEGYIGDLNYAIMEKVLLEKNDKLYDGEGVTEFADLTYNDIIVCDLYDVKDGVIQYAEACTKKDNSWGAFYNYGLGMGAWKVRVLGKSADIAGITVHDTVASRDDNTFTVSISGVRKANIVISSEENVTYVIKKNNNVVDNALLTLKNGDNTFEVTVTSENGKNSKKYTLIVTATNVPTTIEGESILQILNDEDLDTGTYTFTANGQNYPVHMYVYSGNQNWTDSTIPMKNGFGDQYDVATSASTNATRMVIVKVNGDLTNSSTIKPYYNTNYGGPKGFMLYVTGKLTNTGTIDNSHGAKAPGQNVYLWKNANGSYEYIPSAGAAGVSFTGGCNTNGNNGADGSSVTQTGTKRATASGGTGAMVSCSNVSGSGAGTSYSGGTGSGGAYFSGKSGAGGANGGAGGTATGTESGGGGAGNPGGAGSGNKNPGQNGTGGLLIIYANEYKNSGTISAHGANGGDYKAGGGGSGGGSINIFTNQATGVNKLGIITNNLYNSIKGTTNAAGGTGGTGNNTGGNGGTGAINIGEIRNGTYYDLKTIINQDKTAYQDSVTIAGDSLLSIIADNDLATGYHYLVANGTGYSVHLYTLEGNQTITSNKTYGDAGDVATSSTNAQNMVIVKVKGDLTINSGVTVNPYYNNYGGPKGFMLYVTGKLTNNGTIDNSHGAKSPGQNVYLWKNADGSYEYIPSAGAAGVSFTGGCNTNGNNGADGSSVTQTGTKRATASGGTGAMVSCSNVSGSGAGTSYSGGTGSGGAYFSGKSGAGGANGGAGGTATGTESGGGGAGNPGGAGSGNKNPGQNGTGGLLIIYSNEYKNSGTISAHGANGGNYKAGGGGSGGGSINIFTNQPTGATSSTVTNTLYNSIKGTTNAAGGTGGTGNNTGGNGGIGAINIGEIRNGTYYDLKTIINQDKAS